MTRATRRWLTLTGVVALGLLAWPGPAGADTTLGGYSGSASAQPVRIQIYEPTIPIPSTPQIDLGVGYTQVNTDTGPVSRALASYLWPGPVLGDGFGSVVGNDAAKYPIQVDSRTPATADAPSHNTAQLTTGNGMTTSSTADDTRATVTGAGIAGPGIDLLGGLGQGLSQLGGATPPTSAPTADPVPVSSVLGALATVSAVSSTSDVTLGSSHLGKNSLISTAHAHIGDISLLAGLVRIDGVDITATSDSNGTASANASHIELAGVTVAGTTLGLDEHGLDLAGSSVALPKVPGSDLLQRLGISIKATQTQPTHAGASASFAAQGLTISLDTVPLKSLLNVSAITDPLAQALAKIPQLGSQLGPLLGLGPKIVIQLGSVSTSVTAAPAYSGGSVPVSSSHTAPAGTPSGGTGASSGGGGVLPGGSVGGGGGDLAGGAAGTSSAAAPATLPAASTGYTLPPLGAVPKGLILGGLVLAGLAAWGLRGVGVLLFGPGSGCDEGLASGVPDLRSVR